MADQSEATEKLERLLVETSRTFALSIPRLPEPTRREVTVAYLLFRIADTFEDATQWPRAARIDALHEFGALLTHPSLPEARGLAERWAAARPTSHAGYMTLVSEIPAVLEDFLSLDASARAPIRDHVLRSVEGMASFVAKSDERGALVLSGMAELRDYCYAVAGLVGEMLTELFLVNRPALSAAAAELRPRAKLFGEGLQLVNILKDTEEDAAEGRRYIAPDLPRADVFALARRDLEAASEYILSLQSAGAARGILAFTALPVELAWATLERVEAQGPGSKVTRLEVASIVAKLEARLLAGRPAVRNVITRR
ncbi:MAG: squalene/phytoene synthase family protein [Acidobacteria bacterium]|nr:squalene/phytoene synthase family protein [Acidobacteriota bacterium]MCA1609910.1 squalene/phytoene synthase family protein [Acidobacteriota bacterium]